MYIRVMIGESEMFCKNCGNPLEEGSRFCSRCGAKIGGEHVETAQRVFHPIPSVQPARPKPKNKSLRIVIAIMIVALCVGAGTIVAVLWTTLGSINGSPTADQEITNEMSTENLSPDTDRLFLREDRETVSAGGFHSLGLKSDGTVIATGDTHYGACDVSDWTDIVAVSGGQFHSLGLRSDGTVVSTEFLGECYNGQCDVSGWRDIIAISAGASHSLGLRSNGTVVATDYTGEFYDGECDVSGWTDIIAVSACKGHSLGLRSDGTVFATGINNVGQCDVSGWRNIVAVSAGIHHSLGLRSDGTVVSTKIGKPEFGFDNGQSDVSSWTDIVAISAGNTYSLGLKSDGTVVSTRITDPNWDYGQCEVSGWTNIVAISTESFHSLGLRSDGTVVAAGSNYNGEGDASGWTDIVTVPRKANYCSNNDSINIDNSYDYADNENAYHGFSEVINKYLETPDLASNWLEYAFYDIDEDGTKELIVYHGNCEADARFDFYSENQGEYIKLGEVLAGHSTLIVEEDGRLIRSLYHMDCGKLYEISLVDNKVIEKDLAGDPKSLDYENSISFTPYE